MELELRSVEVQEAHEAGGAPRGVGAPYTLVDRGGPLTLILLPIFLIFSKNKFHGVLGHSENFCFYT